jgi:hypothetical protein
MSNNRLFRIAGWCALATLLLMVAAIVAFPLGAGTAGGALELTSFLGLTVVFYALYVEHRAESPGLSHVALVVWFPAAAVDVVSMAKYGNSFLGGLWYTLFSVPFLIFGLLAWRSTKMPRGLAIVALLTGVTYFVSGVSGLLGSQTIADNVSLIPTLSTLVWLGWMSRVFLSGRLADDWSPVVHAARPQPTH